MSGYDHLSKEELLKELEKRDLQIAVLEEDANNIKENEKTYNPVVSPSLPLLSENLPLDLPCIKRYSRQLILPEFGPKCQRKLRSSSVLIVGCGGLGCPAAAYLGAAGIGRLGLVDFDDVEISNLHRQILHSEKRVGMSKAHSVAVSVQDINSTVQCMPYTVAIASDNIMDIIENYDVVLDCTDNVATRYLLNDACVLTKKPLVSGSALRFEGQLTVYCFEDGPCYRCLFAKPPPPETVTNCSDGGVIGAVPGVIGCLQALEAIKILTGIGEVCFKKMILLDALSMSFRNIKLRNRQDSCDICGVSPSIKQLINYVQFCGAAATDKDGGISLLGAGKRISVSDYKKIIDNNTPHILVDVRPPIELEICKLENSINIPLNLLETESSQIQLQKVINEKSVEVVICICRRGNDSQKAVVSLESFLPDVTVMDVVGGLTAWAIHIDPQFPIY